MPTSRRMIATCGACSRRCSNGFAKRWAPSDYGAQSLFRRESQLFGDDVIALDQRDLIFIPCPCVVFPEFGCVLELLLGDRGDVTAKLLVIFQHRPRNRIMLGAHAKESTEAEHSVSNLARPLIDHKIFNAADFLTLRAIDRGSLNL